MINLPYYPGCTLKQRSSHLESSAIAAMEKLGVRLSEIDPWTCCGAVPPPSSERIMNLIAPVRMLRALRDSGENRLVTICDFCYNVLKRANHSMRTDDLRRKRVNAFLRENEPVRDYLPEEEPYGLPDYSGEVRVYHLMEYIRDEIGYERLSKEVSGRLEGMPIASYYGCVMLRPRKEIELDDPENPTIMEAFVSALHATPVPYPYRTECCGSYLSVSAPDASSRLAAKILGSARDHGAKGVVVSCPLCFYNLESRQEQIARSSPGFKPMPVIFFTQLLAIALGIDDPDVLGFGMHRTSLEGLLGASAIGAASGSGREKDR
ncbi:CoB--CoM heterodisulfide reductase iron-sulfur subunit B family protein [Candidatus Fermentibacterales bacterium]|nr:CoB--CoM heterodisulfide reductase iron-sulfur subunit B family protein [Candidatus Fermentibacterales bacterium]